MGQHVFGNYFTLNFENQFFPLKLYLSAKQVLCNKFLPSQGEPDAYSRVHRCQVSVVVRVRMIWQKHSWRNIERNEYVDAVMLMTGQDEKHSEHVHYPHQRVDAAPLIRRIYDKIILTITNSSND